MRRNTPSAASATRLRRSLRHASAHGLRPATAGRNPMTVVCSATAATKWSPFRAAAPLRGQPHLVDQDVPLRVPLVAVHTLREDVDLLRVVEVHPGSLLGVHVVDLRPYRGGLAWVGRLGGLSLIDQFVD